MDIWIVQIRGIPLLFINIMDIGIVQLTVDCQLISEIVIFNLFFIGKKALMTYLNCRVVVFIRICFLFLGSAFVNIFSTSEKKKNEK